MVNCHFNIQHERMVFSLEIQNLSVVLMLWFMRVVSCTSLDQFDYIIVGSGSAGSVLTNRLSKNPSTRVLLLEAGVRPPLISQIPAFPLDVLLTDANWNFTSVPNPRYGFGLKDQRYLIEAGKTLGGSGQLNHNVYARGNRRDYDSWAANGAYGWDWENVFPYFLKVENNRNLGIVANGYHGVGGDLTIQFPSFHEPITNAYLEAAELLGYPIGDFNGPREAGNLFHLTVFMPPQGTIKDGRRYSTLQAFIEPVIGRRNLKILTSAFVTKILIDEHRRAYGVIFHHNGKVKHAIAKREVVVSAGAINTAKLLMLSGIGPKEDLERLQIPVVSDLPVGKNFHDQVSTLLMTFLADTFTYRDDRITKDDYTEFLRNGTGILTTLGTVGSLGYVSTKYNKNPEWPDIEIFWFTASPASDKGTVMSRVSNFNDKLWEYFQPYVQDDTIMCTPVLVHPKSRGVVTLKSSNPYDNPIIDFNFFSDPQDMKILIEGLKFCLKMSQTEPMKRFGVRPLPAPVPGCEKYPLFSDEYFACMILVEPLPFYHRVGTAKMGDPNDPTTVLDPTLKVKGFKGLRVVDGSVIPAIPSGHAHTMVTMIAAKAADIILHDAEHANDILHSNLHH